MNAANAPINIVALQCCGLPSDMTRNGTERGSMRQECGSGSEGEAYLRRDGPDGLPSPGSPGFAAPSPTHWMMPWRSSIET